MSDKGQNRLRILNGVLEQYWSMREAPPLLGVDERQGWRLLAAYRTEGAGGWPAKDKGACVTGLMAKCRVIQARMYWYIQSKSAERFSA